MNELMAATGLPKSTILFYAGQGLLPAPRKTSANMAYYDIGCVERIRAIQQMQERHRLSLSEIKRLLEGRAKGSDFGAFLELDEEVFGPGGPRKRLDAEAFGRESGLSAGQLEELEQKRLLLPHEEGRYDADDLRMGQMYFDAFRLGIRAEDLAYYAEWGEKIVDQEMALRNRVTRTLAYQQDAAVTTQMVKHARMCRSYVIDRLFQRRVAAMKDITHRPAPDPEDREPWLD